jgi:hypothetical protein
MTGSTLQDELHREFSKFVRALGEIDEELKSGAMVDIVAGKNFSDQCAAERMAMMYAVDAVNHFLASQGINCKILHQLWLDLQQVRLGSAVGRLTPKPRAGRKKDSCEVAYLKGRIAGIARLKMTSGQSRDDAAAWVARKIPAGLASQLSSKPIEKSTVKEWIDQYDCGADLIEVLASDEKRKVFESCFPAPTETGKDDDEDPCEREAQRLISLRELVPQHKRRNSISGLVGFMSEIYAASVADGYRPNFDHLLTDLEERPSASSAEVDL